MSEMTAAQVDKVVARARSAFNAGKSKPIEFRKAQLRAMSRMITENEEEFNSALKKDLGINDFFSHAVEFPNIINEVNEALRNLDKWTQDEAVSTPLLMLPGKSKIVHEPYGVILNMAPWNYPLSLALTPCVSAIAAGNCWVVKPSEISAHTSAAIARNVPKYLDKECFHVVEGGIGPSTALLKNRFDFILYTGNGMVGRIVMEAAAKFLTPVALELGGKSPVIVGPDADLKCVANRVTWGKFMNAGQTCIAPDYVLVTPDRAESLVAEIKLRVKAFYGDDPKKSPDFSRIINERHAGRIAALLDDPKVEVVIGGEVDVKNRYVSPTVVRCGPDAKPMADEIFGPILPIITVKDMEAALDFINAREKPLALYLFSWDKKLQEDVVRGTSSGAIVLNDVIMHAANHHLPFGGVGPSGMGAYHGKFGFDMFTHKKAMYTKVGASDPGLRFPPYTPSKLKQFLFLRSVGDKLPGLMRNAALVGVPVVSLVAARWMGFV